MKTVVWVVSRQAVAGSRLPGATQSRHPAWWQVGLAAQLRPLYKPRAVQEGSVPVVSHASLAWLAMESHMHDKGGLFVSTKWRCRKVQGPLSVAPVSQPQWTGTSGQLWVMSICRSVWSFSTGLGRFPRAGLGARQTPVDGSSCDGDGSGQQPAKHRAVLTSLNTKLATQKSPGTVLVA